MLARNGESHADRHQETTDGLNWFGCSEQSKMEGCDAIVTPFRNVLCSAMDMKEGTSVSLSSIGSILYSLQLNINS